MQKYIVTGQEIIPWNGVLPQKLTDPQIVKFPSIGGTYIFITTYASLHPESVSSSPCHPTQTLADLLCHYPAIYAKIFKVVSFAQVSQLKDCTHISCLPYVPHAPPIWFLIWSCEYLLRCTDHGDYSKICIKIFPVLMKRSRVCVWSFKFPCCVLLSIFQYLWCIFLIFLLFGLSLLWAHRSTYQKILPIII